MRSGCANNTKVTLLHAGEIGSTAMLCAPFDSNPFHSEKALIRMQEQLA